MHEFSVGLRFKEKVNLRLDIFRFLNFACKVIRLRHNGVIIEHFWFAYFIHLQLVCEPSYDGGGLEAHPSTRVPQIHSRSFLFHLEAGRVD